MMHPQQELRELAVRCDAASERSFDLGSFWQQIRLGTWLFVDTFTTEARHFAVLHGPIEPPRPVAARKFEILERILLGASPKVVAADCQRALSSITAATQECLRALGLSDRASLVPVLLVMAARAAHHPEGPRRSGRVSRLDIGSESAQVISVSRPDLQLPAKLSEAETAVLRSLVEGHSYAQISRARATSPRTVANQLAMAFRKLGVSGRRDTIQHLLASNAP